MCKHDVLEVQKLIQGLSIVDCLKQHWQKQTMTDAYNNLNRGTSSIIACFCYYVRTEADRHATWPQRLNGRLTASAKL